MGSRVMVVDVIDGPAFSVTSPRVLFEGNFWPEACCGLNYDISPDGKRFVMVGDPVDLDYSRIHVITNWNELAAQTVPGGN